MYHVAVLGGEEAHTSDHPLPAPGFCCLRGKLLAVLRPLKGLAACENLCEISTCVDMHDVWVGTQSLLWAIGRMLGDIKMAQEI